MEGGRAEPAEDFNLREWAAKARMVSRENTNSRRFSAPNIRSFREDTRSFRSNFTISSTASSPGYTLREEIDPSTYSFTTALKALQAKSAYSWEWPSPDGFALNSKWNEAEKYICNPLSGEVPMECLSAKTLSARSCRNLAGRVTMSAPLIYANSLSRVPHSKQPSRTLTLHENEVHQFPVLHDQEKKVGNMITRDVGTQSTPPELSSRSSPSPVQTPSIEERSIKGSEADQEDSPTSNMPSTLLKFGGKVDVKETSEKEETKTKDQLEEDNNEDDHDQHQAAEKKTKQYYLWRCSGSSAPRRGGTCFSWRILWMRSKGK